MSPARRRGGATVARPSDQFASLLDLLEKLEVHRADYRLARIRTESVMVEVYAPGEHWEIEFMDDGTLEIERFRSPGEIHGREALADLWMLLTPTPAEVAMTTKGKKPQKRRS